MTQHNQNKKAVSTERLKWLQRESEDWQEQGLISAEAQGSILNLYAGQEEADARRIALSNILLISLGALLIGGGIILLLNFFRCVTYWWRYHSVTGA